MKLRKLKPDDIFTFVGLEHRGPFRLLHCSFTGATVRSLRRHERGFETMSGKVVAFNSPSRTELVGGDTLVTELMSAKKTAKAPSFCLERDKHLCIRLVDTNMEICQGCPSETASNLALLYDTSVEDAMLALKAGFTEGKGMG